MGGYGLLRALRAATDRDPSVGFRRAVICEMSAAGASLLVLIKDLLDTGSIENGLSGFKAVS